MGSGPKTKRSFGKVSGVNIGSESRQEWGSSGRDSVGGDVRRTVKVRCLTWGDRGTRGLG